MPTRSRLAVRRHGDDDGFVLLESLVTIALITVIMTALTTFFITAMSSTARQRSQQAATQIATSAVEYAHGLGAGGSLSGRDQTSASAQFASGLATDTRVQPWLAAMTTAYDATAVTNRGLTATLPTTGTPQVINGLTYQVNAFIGWCVRPRADDPTASECARTLSVPTVQYVRVVIVVTWPDTSCSAGTCVFVTATLLNGTSEPTFNFNNAPPAAPTLTCAALTSTAGQAVNRSILASTSPATPGCTPSGGVPPYSFTVTGLPAGLGMSGDGRVSGTPSTAGNSSVVVTVTDSFLRRGTAPAFTWTIRTAVTVTAPPNQGTNTGQAATPVSGSVSGGSGAPYTWSATGLPPGITINTSTGQMSGTPTTAGTQRVTLTAVDGTGASASAGFTWTVTTVPLVATSPGDQLTTVNSTVSLALSSSGGVGPVTWSDPGGSLPAGLQVQGSRVTGTATVKVVNRSVTLSATDGDSTRTVSFTWTVDDGPLTVSGPASRTNVVNQAISPASLTVSGGTSPYTWTDPSGSLPAGLAVSQAGVITGTPTTVLANKAVSLTVTDAGNRSAQANFTWTITANSSVTSPGDQTTAFSRTVSLSLATVCGSGPCSVRVSAGSLPPGLSLNTSTAVISGTTSGSASVNQGIVITLTDGAGTQFSTAPFTWYVSNLASSVPTQNIRPCDANTCTFGNQTVTATATGGVGPHTYSVSNVTGGTVTMGTTSQANGTQSSVPLTGTADRSGATSLTFDLRVTDAQGASVSTRVVWTIR